MSINLKKESDRSRVLTKENKAHPKYETKGILLEFGSYLIDGAILRIKTQEARDRIIKLLKEYEELFPISILIRTNPYRTLQILWSEYLRIALRGHPLERFIKLSRIMDQIPKSLMENKYIRKGVRVIPLAPAWLPKNRVLLDLIFEYLCGRIDKEMAKKVFYSAFINIFERENVLKLGNLLKWSPEEKRNKISNKA